MALASFRFYEELNDFLVPERRKTAFAHTFDRRASVKDMVESFGVPHTEVELILANGESVDFSYIVRDGDRISVYPVFESLDISPLLRLRPEPLRHPKFVLDTNLGRLARYLRLLGLDCLYRNDYQDEELARISRSTNRVLLTRDRTLLRHKVITRGYFVRATDPRLQAKEVLSRFDLNSMIAPFTRCTLCNGILDDVEKSRVIHRLEPKTKRYFDRFRLCRDCGQIYWKGSHHDHAKLLIDGLVGNHSSGAEA